MSRTSSRPKYQTNAKRVENRDELDEALSHKTKKWKKAKLLKQCEANEFCWTDKLTG